MKINPSLLPADQEKKIRALLASAEFDLLMQLVANEALALEGKAIESLQESGTFEAYGPAALQQVKQAQEYHTFNKVVKRLAAHKTPYSFTTITA